MKKSVILKCFLKWIDMTMNNKQEQNTAFKNLNYI